MIEALAGGGWHWIMDLIMSESEIKTPFSYQRRKTRIVMVGNVPVGGEHPIRVQSMTNTDTMDTEATAQQCRELVAVGCEIIRITAPSKRAAENLACIRDILRNDGIRTPLVADVHFAPQIAMIAADHVEKVRINPGNYADKKRFKNIEYTDAEYQAELARIEEAFAPLVLKLKANSVALRIGANHGSLSDRIINHYGDTPLGMVESALEFVRICCKYDFHDIILSMKSSNPLVMIHAYRLLAAKMSAEDMDYPFHLGVTEAGEGEDGRIKSAIGIGALLEDGIGDTLRISLTENPTQEVPIGLEIAGRYAHPRPPSAFESAKLPWDPCKHARRPSAKVQTGPCAIGAASPVRVFQTLDLEGLTVEAAVQKACQVCGPMETDTPVEMLVLAGSPGLEILKGIRKARPETALCCQVEGPAKTLEAASCCADAVAWIPDGSLNKETWLNEIAKGAKILQKTNKTLLVCLDGKRPPASFGTKDAGIVNAALAAGEACVKAGIENYLLSITAEQPVFAWRRLVAEWAACGLDAPLVLAHRAFGAMDQMVTSASIDLGSVLCDGIGDALHITGPLPHANLVRLSYNILQSTRLRISKAEFISCPSCGRTIFDLEKATARIKGKLGHLKGVKIAIMGCIVNGPGEMADADFGYVGSGRDRINLYVGQHLAARNIPAADADNRLIQLIKEHGKWGDPLKT